jgi:nucleotide-binding universal stress UspA family protein
MSLRVLLATDGSDDARAAGAWLGHFPVPDGSRLQVLSVASIPPSALDIPPVREYQASLREAATRMAEAARSALAPRFAEADAQMAEGDPREVIVHAAETWKADLVVLGARGLGAIAGALLGSVSLGVARHAPCSVLVVKPGAAVGRRIVIAVDGSPQAAAAAAFVARLPLDATTIVQLVSVAQRPVAPATTPGLAAGIVRRALAELLQERKGALERALAALAGRFAGVKTVERTVLVGHPVEALLGAVGGDVGLVVVGARGLGTVKRLVLGSVSEALLRHVDRPILIVKERDA